MASYLEMREEAATNEVINRFLLRLGNFNVWVRDSLYAAHGKMTEKAAINEVINRLLPLLDDTNDSIRSNCV